MLKKAILLSGLLYMIIGAQVVFAEPNLVLPTNHFDFGYSPANASLCCRFWLYSSGTDTLKITNVRPGCGCTKAPLGKEILPPGDSTMLELIYSSAHASGTIRKSATISTNGSEQNYNVTFAANITSQPDSTYPVIIKPYKLDISQFGEKSRQEMKFSIVNVSDVDLEPTLISCPDDIFKVILPKKIKAGQTGEGTLKLKGEKLGEEFQNSFTISLNDKNNSRFTIPVKRAVRVMSAINTK
jgi:hypothetical protein